MHLFLADRGMLIFLAWLLSVTAAQASVITTFTDRALWNAEVGVGNFVTEEFNVDSDQQLRNNVSNDVGAFNVFYTNASGFDVLSNRVINATGSTRVGPLAVDDFLSVSTNSFDSLEIHFDSPINAFAANFIEVSATTLLTLDGMAVNLFDGIGSDSGFLGWTLDNSVSSIVFSSSSSSSLFVSDKLYLDFVSLGNVSAVPVPAAVWLMSSALLGLFGLSRKKVIAIHE